MNEFTFCVLLLVGPLSTAPTGVGDFSMTINEADNVRIYYGTVEYDKRMKGEVLCRLVVTRETSIDRQGTAKGVELSTQSIVRLSNTNSRMYTVNFPGEKDYLGAFNFGPLLYNAKTELELKALDEESSRQVGMMEKMSFITTDNAKGTERLTSLTAQRATPLEKAWIKDSHIVSVVYKWHDRMPDPKRLEIPAAK